VEDEEEVSDEAAEKLMDKKSDFFFVNMIDKKLFRFFCC
jgi:hypothetical protein